MLFAWLIIPTAADKEIFGRGGSIAVLIVALLVESVGLITVLVADRTSPALRWGVAVPCSVVGAAVAVVAVGNMTSGTMAWLVLFPAVIGMQWVALHVFRVGTRRTMSEGKGRPTQGTHDDAACPQRRSYAMELATDGGQPGIRPSAGQVSLRDGANRDESADLVALTAADVTGGRAVSVQCANCQWLHGS